MDIKTFKKIIKEETKCYAGISPCKEGIKWLDDFSKNCKNTDQFFDKCKKIENKNQLWDNRHDIFFIIISTQHSYLVYIFKYSLDWTEIGMPVGYAFDNHSSEEYLEFIKKNFQVNSCNHIPIPELCEALKRAFK